MKRNTALLLVLVLSASCLVAVLPANARSKTLVVPDDYPTVAAAVGNAADGDTILVKKGTYNEETLKISKTLSLVGEEANTTTINLRPPYRETYPASPFYRVIVYSEAITIEANDVKLSNLTINIHPPGGYISATGDRTQITGNNIATGPETGLSIKGSYCNITDNTSDGLIGLSGSSNMIARNVFSEISVNGDSNTITDNTCWKLKLSNSNHNAISRNKIGAPMTIHMGIYVAGNSSYNVFYGNIIAGYTDLVLFRGSSAENNTFYHNNFINKYDNYSNYMYTSVLMEATTFWDNGCEGNYWDDYNGTDVDRNGIGDVPYVIDADNVDQYPLIEPYDVENDTVVLPPFDLLPAALVAIAIVATVASVAFIVYLKKRRH